jgi:hypothetical protein
LMPCCSNSTRPATASATCGASTPPAAVPIRPRPGRKKTRAANLTGL